MDIIREVEIKFSISRQLTVSRLENALRQWNFRIIASGSKDVRDIYLDTADFWFYRAGVACRLRQSHGLRELCLKTLNPSLSGIAERMELVERLPCGAARKQRRRLPGQKIVEFLRRADVVVVVRPLFRLRQHRSVIEIAGKGGLQISVSRDAVVFPGRKDERFEIEIELRKGEPKRLEALARRLHHRFNIARISESKYEQGLKSAGIVAPCVPYGETHLSGKMRIADAFARLVAHYLRDLEWNYPGVLLGIAPEKIHDFRVALRRLRVVLKYFQPWISSPLIRETDNELKELSALIGPIRDWDTYLRHLYENSARNINGRNMAIAISIRQRDHRRLVKALSGGRWDQMRQVLTRLSKRRIIALYLKASAPRTVGEIVPIAVEEWLIPSVEKATLGSEPKALHKLRRRCRRLRYVAEIMAAMDVPRMEAIATIARDLQTKLGRIQDGQVINAIAKRMNENMLSNARWKAG